MLRTVHRSPKDRRVRRQKLYPDTLDYLKNAHHGLKILCIHDYNVMLLTCLKLYHNVLMSQTRYEDLFSNYSVNTASWHCVWLLWFPQPQSVICFKNGLGHYHNIFFLYKLSFLLPCFIPRSGLQVLAHS